MQDQEKIKALKKLTNPELLKAAKDSVQDETNSTMWVLYILKEVDRRKAFADQNYPSLYEFCRTYLGYEKGAAYRRITALKALKDLPEVEEKIKTGKLDITTLTHAQSYFARKKKQNEPLAKEEKLDILNTLETKSTRETEEFFLELNPREIPEEKRTQISPETEELRLTWPKKLQEKLEELKSLMGPEKANVTTLEAMEKAIDLAIKSYKTKYAKSEEKNNRTNSKTEKPDTQKRPANSCNPQKTSQNLNPKPRVPARGKGLSVHIKRQVWARDAGQCSFVDPITQDRCTCRFRLEVDHIEPKALGGSDELDNLRLLCRAHNKLAAIYQFGINKMEDYLNI